MNTQRFERCHEDLMQFCREYLPKQFTREWTEAEAGILKEIERVILRGGRVAKKMGRGSGKTTDLLVAQLWAYCYRHRRFSLYLAGVDPRATLPSFLEPESRARQQIEDDFGSLLEAPSTNRRYAWQRPIRGSMADLIFPDGDGGTLRPDLVLVDDPENHEDVVSPARQEELERILSVDVLGLGRAGVEMAAVMLFTPANAESVTMRIAKPSLHPEWSLTGE